jgi:nucleoside-diphosphate-sugar epimerase
MEKKVVVTGSAGFLGSYLCDRLITRGEDVLCVDNIFAGTKRGEKLHRAGPSRRGRYHLRRWFTDAVVSYVDDRIDGVLRMMDSERGFMARKKVIAS